MDLNYPTESLSSDDGQIQMNGKYHKYNSYWAPCW